MAFTLSINGSTRPDARYVGWAPSPCVLRATGADRLTARRVVVGNQVQGQGGQLVFFDRPGGQPRNSLTLDVGPLAGAVRFWVGGRFGKPSSGDGDTAISVSPSQGQPPALVTPCMVRVRKNANTLTVGERDRFLAALAQANNQGAGVFQFFRDMHVDAASAEAHFDTGFLPWHRAYLLDLERELQAIDPSVSLPYWRFDQPAPSLFDRAFIGVANPSGAVQFTPTNPLRLWVTDGAPGVNRRPEFDTTAQSARSTVPPPTRAVLSEAATLAIAQNSGNTYAPFVEGIEGNPHGLAHVSFGGFISDIGRAARDPLFFLLHANVDRLWAKWQWLFRRFDPADPASFAAGSRVGHRLADTMWPWNGATGGQRPPTAPGGGLASSPTTSAPGDSPTVRQMLDYQGRVDPAARLGLDYDDVPYDP